MQIMTQPDIASIASCAVELADTPLALALHHFRHVTAYDRTADDCPPTVSHRAIEAALPDFLPLPVPVHPTLG